MEAAVAEPLGASIPPAAAFGGMLPPPRPAKPTLLIVDDEAGPRESLRIVFKDRYNCLVATNGRDGIALACSNAVDAAVIDIKMPDISGIDVLRAIKEHDPDVECVMLTGYETMETARAALRYGASDYLNKPFDVFAIRDRLDICVRRRRQKKELTENLRLLRQTNDELATALAQRDRAATAGVLSAGVVHEINDPLTIITMHTSLLDRNLQALNNDPEVAAKFHETQQAIMREINRCRAIAERFLKFARQNAPVAEITEVSKLLEDASCLIKAHPTNEGLQVAIAPVAADLRARAHPVELLQVIMNLSVNAAQAMGGKGSLRYAAEVAKEVPADCVFRSENIDAGQAILCISVTDSGPGILPENQKKIFTPYFTTRKEGSGLGLAIVCKLVGHFGGAIQLQSTVGKGSTFRIYLALA